jgi:ADP-ribose pyrophosphatase YjhB (NUDIX family)
VPDLEIELIARALAIRANRVLLCKSKKHNYLYLPGGHIEFAEAAPEALIREIHEETGAAARVGGLALVHEHIFRQGPRLRHELNLVFHVELDSEQVTSREKKIAFEWIALSGLDDIDLRPPALRAWLSSPPAAKDPPSWISEPLD